MNIAVDPHDTFRAEVQRLRDRGFQVVRLRAGTKMAFEKDWPKLTREAGDFQPGDNIGVRFGPQSGGLVDVDLDYPTARALAGRPVFGLDHLVEFGRISLPAGQRGHRLAIVPDGPDQSRVFGIRSKEAAALLKERGLGLTVVELRASHGSQTAFPPSVIRAKGGKPDRLVWTDPDAEIPEIAWDELNRRVGRLAFAALAAAVYPDADIYRRNAFCIALFGALLESGVDMRTAESMAHEVALVAGDTLRRDLALFHKDQGLAKFLALAGLQPLDRIVRPWLGLSPAADDSDMGSESDTGDVAHASGDAAAGVIDAETLTQILNKLDPCDFADYESHREMLHAAHHATGGDKTAREVFIDWCGCNPDFGPGRRDEHGKLWSEVVRAMWDRTKTDRGDGAPMNTLGTLLHHLREAGHGEFAAEVARNVGLQADIDMLMASPVDLSDLPDDAPEAAADEGDDGEGMVGGLSYIRADRIEEKPLNPLWPGRIFVGKLTTLAGIPDQGKSLVTCDIAARVSRGAEWPDGSGRAPLGTAIFLAAEDDKADTIRPRLRAAGADLTKVVIVNSLVVERNGGKTRRKTFSIADDLLKLTMLVRRFPDTRVLMIDPVNAFMGTSKEHDSFRDSDVRAVLGPLKEWAEEHQIAVILVTHFKKGGTGRAIDQVMGSLAFVALARSSWAFFEEKDADGDPTGRKLLGKIKQNITAPVDALACHIEGVVLDNGISAPIIVWEEAVEGNADALMSGPRDGTKLAIAKSFLLGWLADGPVPAREVQDAAKLGGIAEKTLNRAKADLGIRSAQGEALEIKGGRNKWYWYVADTEMPAV